MRKERGKIRVAIYIYMMVFTTLLLLVFLALMQVEDFLVYAQRIDVFSEEVEEKYENQYNSLYEAPYSSSYSTKTIVVGTEDDKMFNIALSQLDNIREDYTTVASVNDLTNTHIYQTDVFIVVSEGMQAVHVNYLMNRLLGDKTVVFLNNLSKEVLEDTKVQNLLGIEEYVGTIKYDGYRVSRDFGFNFATEQPKTEFYGVELELSDSVIKYANGLVGDPGGFNQNLPTFMWNYINEDSNSVYVSCEDILDTSVTYAFITQVYSQLNPTYIYPVVNAYMILVEGMPYTTNFESEFLNETYGRDALNMQSSVFFPQLNSSEERHNVKITWYSAEKEDVESTEDLDIKYYLNQIILKLGELAKLEDGKLVSDETLYSEASYWNKDFYFLDEENKRVNLPIVLDIYDFEEELINVDSMVKSTGLLSVHININDYLLDEETDWVDFSLKYETVLSYYDQYYSWMDKVTASEAAKRISTFASINISYNYREDGVDIIIDNFIDKAFFMLETSEEIEDIKGATITEVGNNLYLLEATSDTVKINYEKGLEQ